ncbi:MAG: ribosome silencing factor [Akkermansiaceae bacterium]|nr:ribosome silencing factor [Armatimonadota bacterium]
MAKKNIPSSEKAKIVMETVEERLALEPVLMDLTDKVLLFDYVLVCAGNSDTHVRAITNAVLERIDDENIAPPRVAGQGIGEWVLMDFGDVIVHVLSEEARSRYKLETFWSTEQPKGALPPMPSDDGVYAGATITDAGFDDSDEDMDADEDGEELTDEEVDALDIDDEDPDDVSFFDTADKAVEPIDEPDDLPDETETDETKPDAKGDK